LLRACGFVIAPAAAGSGRPPPNDRVTKITLR